MYISHTLSISLFYLVRFWTIYINIFFGIVLFFSSIFTLLFVSTTRIFNFYTLANTRKHTYTRVYNRIYVDRSSTLQHFVVVDILFVAFTPKTKEEEEEKTIHTRLKTFGSLIHMHTLTQTQTHTLTHTFYLAW